MLCQQRYVVVYVRVSNSCCSASAEFVKEETYKLQIAKGIGCIFCNCTSSKNSITPCTLQCFHMYGRMTYHLLSLQICMHAKAMRIRKFHACANLILDDLYKLSTHRLLH